MEKKEKSERIYVPCYGAGGVEIKGMNQSEVDWVHTAFTSGGIFVRKNPTTGDLERYSTHKQVPDPKTDDDLLPFWRKEFNFGEPGVLQTQEFDKESMKNLFSPHFVIQSVCGYHYTKDNYKRQTLQLESWGFICMRSRRDTADKYWEIFYLPGAWAAKGSLKIVADSVKEQPAQTNAIVNFLCKHASFGTLDVAVQRAAMTMDAD